MSTVGFICEDAAMPRTVFYERFKEAVQRHSSFRETDAELLIPAEDTANETNWPRYGNPQSAYLRGSRPDLSNDGIFFRYLDRIGPRFAVEVLERLRLRHGERFKPARLLMDMARDGKSFHA